MSGTMYFIQECPTCGRRLQVRVNYLGKTVACKHCQGQFVAYDPDNQPAATQEASEALLNRADELLESAEFLKKRPR